MDAEPPARGLPVETAARYGYGLFSARYGNIYTARQLYQLACEAFGSFSPTNPVWRRSDRFFDAMRPSVEPNGLGTAERVRLHRQRHLQKVRDVFSTVEVFVFTFGLTEAWTERRSGTVYPTAPGTIAGDFDPEIYEFRNFSFSEVLADFSAFRELIKSRNPAAKFLLTVSPVPLAATASGEHVLVANTYSKSVLRGVAGELYKTYDDVDYFPSYEIVAAPSSRGVFFESDMRSVSDAGVKTVMSVFFRAHGASPAAERPAAGSSPAKSSGASREDSDIACEDALLEAFAP